MKVIELFAGIGSQTQALKNLEIAHEVIGISEIDKYAIKSYKAMHGLINNFGDITKIEKLPYCDLLTYSFPCQDISVAGKQAGIAIGTRRVCYMRLKDYLKICRKNLSICCLKM
jgi:DNA (cytosine-5)-methyltransferase 1